MARTKTLRGYVAFNRMTENADARTFSTNRAETIERAGANTPSEWRYMRRFGWRTVKVNMAINWS